MRPHDLTTFPSPSQSSVGRDPGRPSAPQWDGLRGDQDLRLQPPIYQPEQLDGRIPGTGAQTIAPTTTLPALTATVTINGLSQPGASATKPLVVISGSADTTSLTTGTVIGLELQASKSTIEGLVIDSFGNGGLWLDSAAGTTGTASGDTIADDFIGVNAAGTASATNYSFPLRLNDGANHDTITGCVISGNDMASLVPGSSDVGIHLDNSSYDNVLTGNKIGVNAAGTAELPNFGGGVLIESAGLHHPVPQLPVNRLIVVPMGIHSRLKVLWRSGDIDKYITR